MAKRDWASSKVECIVCGGSHDGTPSGLRKHEATGKHQAAATAAGVGIGLPEGLVEKAAELIGNPLALPWAKNEDGSFNLIEEYNAQDFEVSRLRHTLIQDSGKAEDALERREADLRWRRKHTPDKADDYEAKKVQPLKDEIERLGTQIAEYDARLAEARKVSLAPVAQFYAALEASIQETFGDRGFEIAFHAQASEWQLTGGYVNVFRPGDRYSDTTVNFGDGKFGKISDKTFRFEPVTISQTGTSRLSIEDKAEWLLRDGLALEIAQYIEAVLTA